jgi:hypothetical protein
MIRITTATAIGADAAEGILRMIIRLVATVIYNANVIIASLSQLLLSNTVSKINRGNLTLFEK